jgi:hypothetical protein
MNNFKIHISILFVAFMFMGKLIHAQSKNPFVKIVVDEHLDSLIHYHTEKNKSENSISGFRIQLYADTDRKQANDIRTKFLQLYPEADAYLIYQQPYFKIRIGDYRNRFESHFMYKQLLKDFDKVLIVPDKINFPKLHLVTHN